MILYISIHEQKCTKAFVMGVARCLMSTVVFNVVEMYYNIRVDSLYS